MRAIARICVLVERAEHDDLVEAIDELGPEMRLHDAHHRRLHLRVLLLAVAIHLLYELRAEVRRHHDHRVAEIDGAALAVGQSAIVEHLQQDVEHVVMRLLDFVEQDHTVRTPPDRFGQVTAFLVADIARRRADQAADRVLFHELAHVDAHHRIGRVEQEFGERLAQLGLADASGT